MAYSVDGFFGEYGGKYVAEILRRALDELEDAFKSSLKDTDFQEELNML